MSTRTTIERWLAFFNDGDAEGIASLYALDAVNHQAALAPVTGRDAISTFHRDTFAGGPLTCTPVNLVIDGEWAALEWTDPQGFRGSGFFRVRDDLIVTQRGYWDSAQLNEIHPDLHGS